MHLLTARTRFFALLGNPVAHSLSPLFQNAALRDRELDGVYLALSCSDEAVPGLLRGIAQAGGGGNVTVPHKEIAARVVDLATEAVIRTGACNTFWLEGGRICGDNTDVIGFSRALEVLLGRDPRGGRVLLLGAGGAARAALHALLEGGVSEIVLLNRSPERATALVDRFRAHAGQIRRITRPDEVRGEAFDVVVNATSLGLGPDDPLPLDPKGGIRFDAALDLVYAPRGTRWVHACAEHAIPAADGIEMLLHQGAAAFERWWSIEAPLQAMRAALPAR